MPTRTPTRHRKSTKRRSAQPTASRKPKRSKRRPRPVAKQNPTPIASITGCFEGQIVSQGQLHIAKSATCNANLKAPNFQIDGKVRGTIVASDTMKLGNTCHVQGVIVTDKLVAANGASFSGQCYLGRLRKAA